MLDFAETKLGHAADAASSWASMLDSSADRNSTRSFIAGGPAELGPDLEQLSQTEDKPLHTRRRDVPAKVFLDLAR